MANITVKLPDGKNLSLEEGCTGFDLAASIGPGLAKAAVGLSIDGQLCDMGTSLWDGASVQIITKKDPLSFEFLRHTAAHILAAAVQKIYPTAKIAIGPTIKDGFYYDFYIPGVSLTPDDLTLIEKVMQEIVEADHCVVSSVIEDVALRISEFQLDGEIFKAELLTEISRDSIPTQYYFKDSEGKPIWSDLCRGPHLPSTGKVEAFKLLSVSSAYWRGDENRESLQRIYGTAFWSKAELNEYLDRVAEAERRDHRKLSRMHELFSTSEEAGAGLILWHPKLGFLRNAVEQFWRDLHLENDYRMVYTPHIARSELWQTSGHTEYYAENMFKLNHIDGQEYILKPMNCPFHVLIYNSTRHSYRELPIRLAEMGTVYRFERSGALHGLARVRGFTQDDAHVFCEPEQLIDEVCAIVSLIDSVYKKFGLIYSAELSTRPKDRIGEDNIWDMAENALSAALKQSELDYDLNAGDGAFYGPKIDFKICDAIGRQWQGATIQVDFNLPERFDLKYTNSSGELSRPVMLHRAIFGSLERFTALLIENYAGAFPMWLCEKQVAILPIADRHACYAQEVAKQLKARGIRSQLDYRAEKVNAKIRDAQLEQIPYMIVLGDKEQAERTVSVRHRRLGDIGSMSLDEFIAKCQEENS